MTEKVLALVQAAKLVPPARNGKKCHTSTLLRWITRGQAGVKLEGLRLGGRWFTSLEALQRFAEALTPDRSADQPTPRTPVARNRADEKARRQLDRLGI